MNPDGHEQNIKHNDVFISYSRKDTEFTTALSKALRKYRPPKDLNVPQRNLTVFRDESDFTGTEYNQALEQHLRDSKKMVLICSPNACKSEYVNEEIRLFSNINGALNIIPVLCSGIPNNETSPGQEAQQAYPEELTKVMQMPLSANFAGFDAKRHKIDKGIFYGSWYKVLADIYGINRSEIEQRDKKRQAKRRNITIAIVGVIIALLSTALVFSLISREQAITARNNEHEQRQIAEQQRKLAEQQRTIAQRQRGIAEQKQVEAEDARDRAQTATDEALKAESRLLTKNAEVELDYGEWKTAGRLALSALPLNLNKPERPLVIEAQNVLTRSVRAARQLTKFHGHKGEVLSADVSPDGNRIITGSYDHTARIWDRSTGRELLNLQGHKQAVTSARFMPDGMRVLTMSHNSDARLWDARTGKLVAVLPGEDIQVHSASINSKGTRLAVTSDSFISIYDPVSGQLQKKIETGIDSEQVAFFSHDGNRVVAGHSLFISLRFTDKGLENTTEDEIDLGLWNTTNGKKLASLDGHKSGLKSAAFSHDGKILATGSGDFTIRLWDANSGNYIRTLKVNPYESGAVSLGSISEIEFSKDDKTLLSTTGNAVRLWDVESGELIRTFIITSGKSEVTQAGFSSDGNYVLAVHNTEERNYIKIWRIVDGSLAADNTLGRSDNTKLLLAKLDPSIIYVATLPDFSVYLGAGGKQTELPEFDQTLIDEAKKLFD